MKNPNLFHRDMKMLRYAISLLSIFAWVILLVLRTSNFAGSADSADSLLIAAEIGMLDEVKILLDSGEDVNVTNESGWTALMQAAMNGHRNIVNLLISRGADVNARGDAGWEALMLAAQFGHLEIVRDLIESKARINAQSINGSTALMFAAGRGQT